MAAHPPAPLPDPQPQQSAQGQVLPPAASTPPLPQGNFQQFTAIAAYVPPHVWTTEALLDFHGKQKEVILDNNRVFENHQKRQHKLSWAGLVLIGGIIAFGLYLVAIGNAYGKDLVGATVLFLAGYMAGKGEAGIAK